MVTSLHRTLNVPTILALLALLALSTAAVAAAKPVAQWHSSGHDLVCRTPKYALDIDSATGAPKSLSIAGHEVVAFGKPGWWRATFEDGSVLDGSHFAATLNRVGDDVVCKYSSPKITVQLRIHPAPNHVDLHAYVAPSSAVVTRFALPQSVEFLPASINEVDYPEEIGRALKPAFFERQPDEYAQWKLKSIGPTGASDVGVLPCQMRDYNDPPVAVSVTPQGRDWLGADARIAEGWQVKCPRAPAGAPTATLLDTANGPLLSMESIGAGRFIRWAGLPNEDDERRIAQISAAVLRKLGNGDSAVFPPVVTGLGQIGLIDLNGDGRRERHWESAFAGFGRVVEMHTPAQVRHALAARNCWAIVNLGEESMPCAPADEKSTATLIHDFMAHGGVWLHTGAAPFYYTVAPQPYHSLDGSYPPLFSDFMHIDGKLGQVSVYGVQKQDDAFVPAHLSVGASAAGGSIGRAWITWIEPGAGWTSPIARIAIGEPVDKAVRAYGVANGFTRPLASKIKPAVLKKLKQSLLINYSGRTFNDEAAYVSHLPSPSLIHIWDYLHGGFDKQYPDHLPPNPAHGSPADFKALIDAVHANGDLFMPYTNPTWWCDGPPGPTLIRDGHAPLLVDRQGKNVKEVYGRNWGWALCTFHPEARAAETSILHGFSVDYPVDVLFQDQIGARSPEYDFNTAAPNPDSYTEGMREIAERDSRVLPVGTENGFDAVMNAETMFCGVCWGLIPTEHGPDWVSLWRDRYAPGTWTTRPIALWLAHDKVVFTMHDLGQFVTNRETLTWTLALGYELSARTTAGDVERNPSDPWIAWIAALQKDFGPRIIGASLRRWQEIHPGVFEAVYGTTTVISNTTPSNAVVDGQTTLAPFGFVIVDPAGKREAGSVVKYRGTDYSAGLDFISTKGKIQTFAPGR